jgi:hypothetical protein
VLVIPRPNADPHLATVSAPAGPTRRAPPAVVATPQAAAVGSPNWAATCPNGDCYGQTSPTTGLPRTQYVQPYVRKDGTVVGGYYRSHR